MKVLTSELSDYMRVWAGKRSDERVASRLSVVLTVSPLGVCGRVRSIHRTALSYE